MQDNRTYGEFFPVALCPFAYNETMAQEDFPLTREQATSIGYSWRDPDLYSHRPTITADALPNLDLANEDICSEIIGCSTCDRSYRIIQAELEYLKRFHIALPRRCPDCRHRERFLMRNPYQLWHRTCARCPNVFETSYTPDRAEIVYCEQCYQSEVL